MKHLNYCRQMTRQLSEAASRPDGYQPSIDLLNAAISKARNAQKFILPEGGRLIDDVGLKALDDSEPLRLPFPVVALEYELPRQDVGEGKYECSKRIVLAAEDGDWISITPVFWADHMAMWLLIPPVKIPRTGYLRRDVVIDGHPIVLFQRNGLVDVPDQDYAEEAYALLGFVNALSCSNVGLHRSNASPVAKAMRKAIPYDDYYILTIKGAAVHANGGKHDGHRSPREHLRRGHIRVYQTGLKVWVNAHVVNPGVGGKIVKDYAVAA